MTHPETALLETCRDQGLKEEIVVNIRPVLESILGVLEA